MPPRPEFEVLGDRYVGSIPSPTTVTNGIREPPKSPHHPRSGMTFDHRGKPRITVTTTTITPTPTTTTPAVVGTRRRSLEEMGKNVLSCTAPSNSDSPHYPKTYVRSKINGCYDTTMTAAGDFAMTTSEIYRQECRSDGQNKGNLDYGSQKDQGGNKGRNDRVPLSEDNSVVESFQTMEWRETNGDNSRRKKSGTSREPKEPQGSRQVSGARIDPEDDAAALEEQFYQLSPPRVGRTSAVGTFDPRTDQGNIEEARMELYFLGQDGISPPENKLARALDDLKRQDKVIDGWKRQLEMTQKHLDDTFAELQQTKKESEEKQLKASELRSKAIQERKKVHDMYEAEAERRKTLEGSVAKLQSEISTLKVTLRNARNSTALGRNSSGVGPSAPRNTPDSKSQNLIMTLKAEVVDLRSQLVLAHAGTIDDNSVLNVNSEISESKATSSVTKRDISRTRDQDIQAVRQSYEDSVRLLHEKIERMEKEFKVTRTKLEENLKVAIDEENLVRAELNKFKANSQRLERERSRTRIHSGAEVERLNRQLAATKREATALKEKASRNSDGVETGKLKQEIAELKKKLQSSRGEDSEGRGLSMNSGSKLKSELTILREELEMRKQQLKVKSDETTLQASRIAELESLLQEKEVQNSQRVTSLENEIKVLKASEVTLRSNVASQQALVEQERKQTVKAQSLLKAQYANETVRLDQLRREIEEHKEAGKKSAEQDELIAKLRSEIVALEKKADSLHVKSDDGDKHSRVRSAEVEKEMKVLKAKLSETETKCLEECSRANNERRLHKENINRYEHELEEMRRDNEKSADDKMKLREELEELRKVLANGITGAIARPSATTEESDQSSKVNKLRNDLAVARARLVAARDQTGHLTTIGPPSVRSSVPVPVTADVIACDKSTASSSMESLWVPKKYFGPPLVKDRLHKLEDKKIPLDEEYYFDEHTGGPFEDIPIEEKKEDCSEPSPRPSAADAEIARSHLKKHMRTTTNAFSLRGALVKSNVSLIDDDDEDDDDALPESSLPPRPPTYLGDYKSSRPPRNSSSVRESVDELRRQLRESSKRLEQANSRLSSLAEHNLPNSSAKTNVFSTSTFRGLNHTIVSSHDDPGTDCILAEMVATGEDGEIEVQHIRYADI